MEENKETIALSDPFFVKVATVSAAALAVLFISAWYVTSTIEDLLAHSPLKGGHTFWSAVELKMDRLADAPDLPPQKKERIIKALNKLSAKYRPYLDALAGSPQKQVSVSQ